MRLILLDKQHALKRIAELDQCLFLTPEEQEDYRNRIEIVQAFDQQFRNDWKSDRRAWINSQFKKNNLSQVEADTKYDELDIDADQILGVPTYPWQ